MQQASLEHEEIQSLKQQLQKMKELLRASQPAHTHSRLHESVETERYKIHIEKLISLVIDREKKIESLQQEKNVLDVANERIKVSLQQETESKKLALEEVKALHAQFGFLKKIVAETKGQIKEHENEKAKWQGERETLVQQLDAATQGFHEKTHLQQECELLKDKNQELTSQIERASATIKESDKLLQAKEERLIGMQGVLMHTEKRLQEVVDEKYQIQDKLLRVQNAQEDAEARLKVAQFHLAKKVKEATELNDKLQSQEIYLREAYADLTTFQNKAQDLQMVLDDKEKEKIRLEKQLQEAALSSQNSFIQLEEKCLKLTHKCKEYESQLAEMKKLEEKHRQLQGLLANINGFFEQSSVSFPQNNPSNENLYSPSPIPEEEENRSPRKPYQNLFDMPKQAPLVKQSFFE